MKNNELIKNLSISDLKSAYDFIEMNLEEIKKKGDEKGETVSTKTVFKERKELQSKIHDELINRLFS